MLVTPGTFALVESLLDHFNELKLRGAYPGTPRHIRERASCVAARRDLGVYSIPERAFKRVILAADSVLVQRRRDHLRPFGPRVTFTDHEAGSVGYLTTSSCQTRHFV